MIDLRHIRYLFVLVALITNTLSSSQSVIDSLANKLQYTKGEEKVNLLIAISSEYYYNDIEKSINYAEQALKLAATLNYKKGEADALHRKATALKKINDKDNALNYFYKSIKIREKIKDTIGLARSFNKVGNIYYDKSDYDKAEKFQRKALEKYLEYGDKKGSGLALNNIGNIFLAKGKFEESITYYQDALKIFEEIDFKAGIASCFNNIGNVNDLLANSSDFIKLEKAIEYYRKALEIEQSIENFYGIANSYNNIGIEYTQIAAIYKVKIDTLKKDSVENSQKIKEFSEKMNENFDNAIEYLEKGLETRIKIDDLRGEASALTNIGAIYSNKENHSEALKYFFRALEINKKLDFPIETATTLYYIGQAYKDLKQYEKAAEYLEQSKKIAEKTDLKKIRKAIYNTYSEVFENQYDYKNALRYYKLFFAMNDSLYNEESLKAFEEMQTKYETEKKEQQINLLNKDKELREARIKQQKQLIYMFIVVFLAVIGFVIVILRQYQQKKKANIELEKKNQLITQQKQEITDSILYARRIQTAILPPGDYIKNIFPERFILFKPRDIVSGDFYWIKELPGEDIVIVTAADCTGHGVPGAFMSMLGVAFLNEIVNKPDVRSASAILGQLRSHVITSLHQTGRTGEAQDGMDIALCAINFKTNVMEFAGANNPLYLIRNNELTEIKGDKMPIGIHIRKNNEFTNHKIQLQKNDCIYIFSDGFPDQFGGPKAKKFKYKPFKELLKEIHTHPMDEQERILNDTFEKWKGDLEQIDDIIIIGIKIT